MKETTQILQKLRSLMNQLPQPISSISCSSISAYIVPSDDAHQSEYICKFDERRSFVSGFNGSAGTVVVTTDKALLWTDGRYYQQALKQLDTNWLLMKDGLPSTPSLGNWMSKNLPKGSVVGVDPKLLSYRAWKPIQKDLNENDCTLVPIEQNLIDLVWGEAQPQRSSNEVITLGLEFTGEKIAWKWDKVKKEMIDKKCEILIISALDEVAWFLNLRGSDIDYNPVFFSYLIVMMDKLILFIDSSKLPDNFKEHQVKNEAHIEVTDYEQIGIRLHNIVDKVNKKVWIAPSSSYYLNSLIPKSKRHQEITPVGIMKAVKNNTEVEGFINCHIRDGVALCQYFAWLENAVAGNDYVDEISGASKLEEFRSKLLHYRGLSFATISASGINGSVIHYHPEKETNRRINRDEIYLCDSGAQYLDGTTDVTRTMHFGQPTDFQKETYTRVLKGQLSFASTIFPRKVKGQVLDTLARKFLWDVGLDYGHGTGHGVGHYLNVHEGPMGVGIRLMPDDPGLQENMFISNEPGFYHEGEFGIRIEDIVQIIPASPQYNFAGRQALTFKTITLCPKQTKLIKKILLNEIEVKQINDYHQLVFETLSPILKEENDTFTLTWLEKETQPL